MANEQGTGPAIRTFQFDDDGIGAIKNSVNLFRGDVGFSLNLVSLKGRNGLDTSLSLMYQSNVQDLVEIWNLDAPTSVVGLGWSLPIEKVVVDSRNSASTIYNNYALVVQGQNRQLVPSRQTWLRLTLPPSMAPDLSGPGVSQPLRQAFAGGGIALSQQATIAIVTTPDPGWLVDDPGLEACFFIEETGSGFSVFDGGQQFETKHFEFWRIRHYPTYNRWAITREDGITASYGGGTFMQTAPSISTGNSIEWGIKHQNWLGSSTLVTSDGQALQQQFPVAWNLAILRDVWNDTILFEYEQVRQNVGDKGLPYTKASYLKQISDVFNRKVTLNYGEKIFDGSKPDGMREYMDPHKPMTGQFPNNDPDAYQSRYETRFLQSIDVTNEQDEALFSIAFDYADLQNLTNYPTTSHVFGSTFKRFLSGFTKINADGSSLPGINFRYEWSKNPDKHRGALLDITYPQGGTASFNYEKASLPQLSRETTIEKPTGFAKPRMWFGEDYAVNTWYRDNDDPMLQVTVQSWLAGWFPWQPEGGGFNESIDIDSLQVVAKADFFALSFFSKTDETHKLFLFHRDDRARGSWLAFSPTNNRFGDVDNSPKMAAGDHFLVMNWRDDARNYHLERFSWNRQSHAWDQPATPLDSDLCQASVGKTTRRFFLAAQLNYYVVLCYDQTGNGLNRMQIFFQNSLGDWFAGPAAEPSFVIASTTLGSGQFEYFRMIPSSTSLAINVVTRFGNPSAEFTHFIFQWDEDFKCMDTSSRQGNIQRFIPELGPDIANDQFISFGTQLRRYNGNWAALPANNENTVRGDDAWLAQNVAIRFQGSNQQQFHWYATGDGYLVKSDIAESVGANGELYSFDPNIDSAQWQTQPQTLFSGTLPDHFSRRFFSTAAGRDYFTYDRDLFFRVLSNQVTWSEIDRHQIYRLGQDLTEGLVDTTTIQNQAPGFVAYLEIVDGTPTATAAVFLRNGAVQVDTDGKALVWRTKQRLFQFFDASDQTFAEHPNGKMPSGNGMFNTFKGRSLDDAQSLTIYRYIPGQLQRDPQTGEVSGGISGPLDDFRVATLTIDDGYNSNLTSYGYDDATAGYDPSGQVAKYFKVTAYPGTGNIGKASYGREVSFFHNGLPQLAGQPSFLREAGDDPTNWTMLEGMLLKKEKFLQGASQPVQTSENQWQVFESIESDKKTISLWGGWVRTVSAIVTGDGVATTSTTRFDPRSGQPATETSENYDGRGNKQPIIQTNTYAFTQYPWLQWQNAIKFLAQQTTTVGGQLGAAAATAFLPWQRPAGDDSNRTVTVFDTGAQFQWLGGSFVDFPWSTWQPGQDLADWQLRSLIKCRTITGRVSEAADVYGRIASTVYDNLEELEVANFGSASVADQEAEYYGFESYETNPGWQSAAGSQTIGGIAHAGQKSFSLTQNGILRRSLQPATQDRAYFFSCWYLTADGFTAGSGSGWQINLKRGTTILATFTPRFEAVDTWTYLSQVLDLAAHPGSDPITIELMAQNKATSVVYLDDLSFAPFATEALATVYRASNRLPVANVGPFNRTERIVYDRFDRRIGDVGPDEVVNSLTNSFLSRQAQATFDPDNPNNQLTLHAAGDGFYQDFRRDPNWQGAWEASTGSWQVRDGVLAYSGTVATQLRLKSQQFASEMGIRLQVGTDPAPTTDIGLTFGPVIITYQVDKERWRLSDGTTSKTISVNQFQGDWLLLVNRQSLLFQAAGQRIFSHVNSAPLVGTLAFFAQGSVTLSDIVVFSKASVSVKFSDASDKEHQRQALIDTRFVVRETVYDDLGRVIAKTKAGEFQASDDGELLTYRGGFVTGISPQTGVMSGEVAQQYPNDGGYPYWSTRFEAGPEGRPLEQNVPGADFAINLQVPIANRRTTQLTYTNNTDGAWPPADKLSLPAKKYPLTMVRDPNDVLSYQLSDLQQNQIASGINHADGSPQDLVMSASNQTVDPQGNTINQAWLPNAFQTPALKDTDQFLVTQTVSPLGLGSQTQSPDTGKISLIYDRNGQLRFVQDPRGRSAAKPYIIYYKYDQFDRIIEQGWLPFIFGNGSQLQAFANRPNGPQSFPIANNGSFWTKKFKYDGDGSDIDALGRMASSLSRGDSNGSPPTTETFRYDTPGNIRARSLATPEYNNGETIWSYYTYNNSKKVTGIDYLSDVDGNDSALSVAYHYNQAGQMLQVSNRESGAEFAAYTYEPSGALKSEILNPGAANEEVRNFCYSSPGWLTAIQGQRFSETLTYTSGGYQNGVLYSENLASATSEFKGLIDPPADFLTRLTYRFGYDRLYRLQTAQCDVDGITQPAHSFGINNQPVTYLDNGNIDLFNLGCEQQQYRYNQGTDQIKNTNGDSALDYGFDSNGNLVKNAVRGFSLNPAVVSQRAMTITPMAGATALQLGYGKDDQRILKKDAENSLIYVHGMNPFPLAEICRGTLNATTLNVYGLNGLVATVGSNGLQTVIADHEGSTRAVVDDSGTVIAAYNYLPFGEVLGGVFGPNSLDEAPVRYLYTGQERDPQTGIYNFRARLYDPQLRLFYGVDPKFQGTMPYGFTQENPVNFIDPTGESSNIFGLVFSSLELGFGLLTGSLWLAALGTEGLIYSARAKDKFDYGNFFSVEASTVISINEIGLGLAIDVLTEGAGATTVGAALLGAGISGLINTTEQASVGSAGSFSWSSWGIDQATGFAGGAITGGFGSFGALAGKVAGRATGRAVTGIIQSGLGDAAVDAGSRIVQGVVRTGIQTLATATGGFVSSVASQSLGQAMETGKVDWSKVSLSNAGILAAVGGAAGLASGSIGSLFAPNPNFDPIGPGPSRFSSIAQRADNRTLAALQLIPPVAFNTLKVAFTVIG